MEKITLAVVEDQNLFRQGLLALLKEFPEMDVILEAENGKVFVEKLILMPEKPTAVLLDLDMPEMDGFDVTVFLRKKFPEIRIIILTHYNSEELIRILVKKGAHGFLMKSNDIEIIIDSIHAVIENGYFFNDKVSKALIKDMVSSDTIKPNFKILPLTEREVDILVMICKERTNIQIADLLSIDVRTVEKHKQNIILKTNSKNIIGAVMYAMKSKLYTDYKE